MNGQKLIAAVGSGLLLILVVWAFMLVGSPSKNRELAADRDQLAVLKCAACHVQKYMCYKGAAPENMGELTAYLNTTGQWCTMDNLNCYASRLSREITAEKNWVTRLASVTGYQSTPQDFTLCSDMQHSFTDQKIELNARDVPSELQQYAAGHQCFHFKFRECPKK